MAQERRNQGARQKLTMVTGLKDGEVTVGGRVIHETDFEVMVKGGRAVCSLERECHGRLTMALPQGEQIRLCHHVVATKSGPQKYRTPEVNLGQVFFSGAVEERAKDNSLLG